MHRELVRMNPLKTLRIRLGLIVMAAILALTLLMSAQFSKRLTESTHAAAEDQLTAIARTWDDGFRGTDFSRPEAVQRRIDKLRENTPTLHKIVVSWRLPDGRTTYVTSGHHHDPDGVKRDVSTDKPQTYWPAKVSREALAPIDAKDFRYHEVSATDGAHYGELNYPVERRGQTIAALELHYDLKALDAALARDKRTLFTIAVLAALTLALLVNLILGRNVLTPLDRLREATRRIKGGETGTRLNWSRKDELGVLARDFDEMAEELETVHNHLEELALRDPLTGILNHRAFQERLTEELRRAERERYSLAVVAFDVDHFKEINDRYGHAAGDEALRVLAEALKAVVRPSDICGRIGGDEFMLGLVNADAEHAEQVISRLRKHIASMEFGTAADQEITISAGIAEFPRHSLHQEELMYLADGAMYWAKSNGRNRSFIYTADSSFALSPQEAADRLAREGLVNTVHALAKAVDARDGYTHQHSNRVAGYARLIAERLGLESERVRMIETAGVLHDLGKIGISDAILGKPDTLTGDEFETMKRHSVLGRDIVAGAGMHEIAKFVLHLHERYDGRGYPDGLSGTDISIESRILHIADAFEAMTSSRVYRDALPVADAVEQLVANRGTQFDPDCTDVMLKLIETGEVSPECEQSESESESEPRASGTTA